jgi:hypothetical protein
LNFLLFELFVFTQTTNTTPAKKMTQSESSHPASSIRPLYGGAIIAKLPEEFKDVSDVRPVPDHQEVFLNDHEVSIISELLDLGHDQSDDVVLQYYFHDLANNNESQQTQILHERLVVDDTAAAGSHHFMPMIGGSHTKMMLIGKQSVKKYRSETSPLHDVYIIMTLIRLRNVDTDVLLTLNIPSTLLPIRNISSETLEMTLNLDLFLSSTMIEDNTLMTALPELQIYRDFLQSFHVRDWQLFGGQ